MKIPIQSDGKKRSITRRRWVGAVGLHPARIPLSRFKYTGIPFNPSQPPAGFTARSTVETPSDFGVCVAACKAAGGKLSECMNDCLDFIDVS